MGKYTNGFTEVRCGGCDVIFWMTDSLYNKRRKDGESFYCPNGCCRHYTVGTDEDKLKKAQELARVVAEQADHDRAMREIAERTCPWPTCDGRVLASPRGLRQHMVKAHGAPWASPELDIDEVGQVLNGRDPSEVVG